ncbi:PEP-CTERM sorting domain-containing protein [uncultured Paraglaciecola sp.]|uniref:PEP-CTERM sorting domain-containing protein n=1 Tax=uncultured Paraglaciecola sp. TaxID=1765024 RepID=UPI0030D81A34|tara:strand:- start:1120 stop:1851 length:732 start_codon:yes stop_codon:yes gene_type:complete
MKKIIFSAALALGLSMSAHADPVSVGGVNWDTDSGADFQSNGNIYETFAGAVGETVTGFGVMTNFNGTLDSVYCPGCELTYTFSLELVSAIPVVGLPNASIFAFDNVVFDIMVDDSPDYDEGAPSLASASDGVNFLSFVNNGLLTGLANNLFSLPNIQGSGSGFLDVVGGLAMEYFDTNGKLNGSDVSFTSSFQPAQLNVPGYPLFGSLDLSGDTVVPEPSSLALLGLGMLGLAFGARRKSVK